MPLPADVGPIYSERARPTPAERPESAVCVQPAASYSYGDSRGHNGLEPRLPSKLSEKPRLAPLLTSEGNIL